MFSLVNLFIPQPIIVNDKSEYGQKTLEFVLERTNVTSDFARDLSNPRSYLANQISHLNTKILDSFGSIDSKKS